VQDLALGDLGLVDLVPLGEGPLDRSFRRRRSMASSNALFGASSASSTTSLSPEV
jgi:hypothetical protein